MSLSAARYHRLPPALLYDAGILGSPSPRRIRKREALGPDGSRQGDAYLRRSPTVGIWHQNGD